MVRIVSANGKLVLVHKASEYEAENYSLCILCRGGKNICLESGKFLCDYLHDRYSSYNANEIYFTRISPSLFLSSYVKYNGIYFLF